MRKVSTITFWLSIVLLSIYFYWDNAIAYLYGYRSVNFGDSFSENRAWFVAHIAGASFSLFLGPLQFWKAIRTKWIRFHRVAGRLYVIGSMIAALSAMKLSLISECHGCRYPLFGLSVLFLLTTSLAWYAVITKNMEAHRQFVVRSYACALAFVFVRLYQLIPMDLYASLADPMLKRTVNEWIFSFLPLLTVEIVMVWIPSVKRRSV